MFVTVLEKHSYHTLTTNSPVLLGPKLFPVSISKIFAYVDGTNWPIDPLYFSMELKVKSVRFIYLLQPIILTNVIEKIP